MQDHRLLQDYVQKGSQTAFSQIVSSYQGLVYSVCLRQIREPQLAEDAAQIVFILLAQKAPSLRSEILLPGWLYNTARFVARDILKQEARRRRREQQIVQEFQQACPDPHDPWDNIEPLLDDALASLNPTDREAVLLRYFAEKSLKETGALLGTSEAAARMRTARAVDKLRQYFARKGVRVTGVALACLLAGRAVRAAPAGNVDAILRLVASGTPGPWSSFAHPFSKNSFRKGVSDMIKVKTTQVAVVAVGIALVTLTGGYVAARSLRTSHAKHSAHKVNAGVYVCKICKCYYTPGQAKFAKYTEGPGGHKMVWMARAPKGYVAVPGAPDKM